MFLNRTQSNRFLTKIMFEQKMQFVIDWVFPLNYLSVKLIFKSFTFTELNYNLAFKFQWNKKYVTYNNLTIQNETT